MIKTLHLLSRGKTPPVRYTSMTSSFQRQTLSVFSRAPSVVDRWTTKDKAINQAQGYIFHGVRYACLCHSDGVADMIETTTKTEPIAQGRYGSEAGMDRETCLAHIVHIITETVSGKNYEGEVFLFYLCLFSPLSITLSPPGYGSAWCLFDPLRKSLLLSYAHVVRGLSAANAATEKAGRFYLDFFSFYAGYLTIDMIGQNCTVHRGSEFTPVGRQNIKVSMVVCLCFIGVCNIACPAKL